MAQGYERKDNRPKMCFKGDWTKDHHVEDLLLTFVLLSFFAISGAPFSARILSHFFFLLVLFLCLHVFAFSRVSSILFFFSIRT